MSKSTTTIALTLTIKDPTEYVDRSLATASWWDKYTLLPGTYEVEWEVDPYSPRNRIERGHVKVDAILTESYRENRLFTAVSADHKEDLAERTTVHLSLYPWVWMQYAGKPSTEPQIWGGIVDYAASFADA